MAEAPAPTKGGALGAVTRKVGPLPLWAWVGVVVLGYVAYRHFRGGGSTGGGNTAGTPATTDQAYVPGFDAAGASGGGGIGSTATPGVVNNYYYGDQAAQQAAGGGTAATGVGSPTGPGGVMTPGGPGPSGGGPIHGFGPGGPISGGQPSAQRSISYYVPASTQVAHPLNVPVAV